ncbi:hypothetical protein A2U01_0081689, partial [Trifolium medium]|nr:hypothetical protein [Trifolium medium]
MSIIAEEQQDGAIAVHTLEKPVR